MTVFKATNQDMTCTLGSGAFVYQIGVPAWAPGSLCGRNGLHACEYVLDCARYYSLGDGNRFFLAEAEGDIAEDGTDTRIACTRLTLIKELSRREIAGHAMMYMVKHPKREGWKKQTAMVEVAPDRARARKPESIAIARGPKPVVKGVKGSHLGLIQEDDGNITYARLFTVGQAGIKPDTWYTLERGRIREAKGCFRERKNIPEAAGEEAEHET